MSNRRINLLIYKNLKSNSFQKEYSLTWNQLKILLNKPKISSYKYDRGLAIFGDMRDEDKYRNNNNIAYKSAITIDYDDLSVGVDFISIIKLKLSSIAWCIYSTHSHSEDNPRYRVVIPLSEDIEPQYYAEAVRIMAEYIGIKFDEKSSVPSQLMNLPIIKCRNSEYIFEYNDAQFLETEDIRTKVVEKWLSDDKSTTYEKRRDNYWAELGAGVSKGGRNNAIASLTGKLLRCRVPDELAYQLILHWNEANEPPLDEKELNKTFLSIFNKHYHN